MSESAGSPFLDPEDPRFNPEKGPPPLPRRTGQTPPPLPPSANQYGVPQYFYLNIGEVFSHTFRIWFRNLFSFGLISLVIYSPLLVGAAIFFTYGPDDIDSRLIFDLTVGLTDTAFFTVVLTASITYGVVENIAGRRPGPGRCLSVGLARMLPVLGVTICYSLLTFLGMLACIIPGLIVMTLYYVAVPAAVVERPGVFKSLSRSLELTKGYRSTIFGIILLFWLIIGVISAFVMIPVTFAAGFDQQSPAVFFITRGFSLVIAPLGATVPAVIYYLLRTGKEGATEEELARVFE